MADAADRDDYFMGTVEQQRCVVLFANESYTNARLYPCLQSVLVDKTTVKNYLVNNRYNEENIKAFCNYTNQQMKTEIVQLEKDLPDNCSCLVMMFNMYGVNGKVYGVDSGDSYKDGVVLQQLLAPLKNSLKLAGKPKIIILQLTIPEPPKVVSDAAGGHASGTFPESIPGDADFLYLWSRIPGDKYGNFATEGSLFIHSFIRRLEDNPGECLVTSLRRVNEELSNMLPDEQDLPFVISQLRKRVRLNTM